MGVIYLIYSAYFLSADFRSWTEIVNIIVASVYLILGVINLRNIFEQQAYVKRFMVEDQEERPAVFQ